MNLLSTITSLNIQLFFLTKGGVDFLPTEPVDLECIAVSGGLTAHGTRPRDQFHLTVLSLPENNEFSLVVVRVINDRHMNKSRFVDYDVIIMFYENDVRYTSDVFAFVWACFLIRKYPVSV